MNGSGSESSISKKVFGSVSCGSESHFLEFWRENITFFPGTYHFNYTVLNPGLGSDLEDVFSYRYLLFSNLDGNFNEFESWSASSIAKECGSFSDPDPQPWIKLDLNMTELSPVKCVGMVQII
jgi:hypothetical protein